MNIELHLQVWNELKPHLVGGDLDQAADDFVHVLIEHGADATEIATYAIDSAVKKALQEYVELDIDEDEFEDEWEFQD